MLLSRVAGRLTRTAAALLVTVVALVGLPRPAMAAESYVGLLGFFNAQALAIGTAGKEVALWYGAYSVRGAALPDTVTVKVDTTQSTVVSARLAEPTPGCSAAGGVFTCTKDGDAASGVEGDFGLVFTAGTSAQVGSRAPIKLTVSAPGVETKEFTYELLVTEPGPDLLAQDFTKTSTPGGTVTFRPTFKNQGDRIAQTIVLTLGDEAFSEVTDKFSNCHIAPDDNSTGAICVIRDVDVEPGEVVTTSSAISVKITPDVPGRTFAYYSSDVFANGTDFSGMYWNEWPKGTGPALGLQTVPADARDTTSDVDYVDSQGAVRITTPANPSDVVAQGATATGKVGDTVSVKVGLSNKGPGFIAGVHDSEASDPENAYNAAMLVTFPAGVEVTKVEVPDGEGRSCYGIVDDEVDEEANKAGRSEYRCMKWSLAVNEAHHVTFTVKITGSVTTAGSVVARGGSSDPATANNTAKIEFTGQDGLPITGVNVGLTAATGGMLIVAGFGVYLLARRRRAVFVTE